jgi:glycosyltransferase involved in cell wall biosynthesis
MRVLFALPGLHRYNRGAEVAFISVAIELARAGDSVTLIGSGQERAAMPYRFSHAASVARENFETFPSVPALRNECSYEELTFIPDLLRRYRPAEYDITLTCSYPFTNWMLRRPALRGSRPPHVFVTQNGDWPAYADNSEYRFFGCEGLVCTNPDFYERNKHRWRCRVIPNGVHCDRFRPGQAQRQEFGLPEGRLIVLMVSALILSKRVELGIEAVSRIPNAHLLVAGDGPLRQTIDAKAAQLLPGRFTRVSVPPDRMPGLYRSADVFMHLSKEEAFGNVFLEAMACGLPVVAGDSSRVRWIVGDDEFLFDVDDPAAIARKIEVARDAPLAQRQSRATKAAAFSWTRIAGMYREFLQEVAASSAHTN